MYYKREKLFLQISENILKKTKKKAATIAAFF